MMDDTTENGRLDSKVAGRIHPRSPEPGLDPAIDPERWERMVGRVMAAAQPQLLRRSRTGTLDVLGRWMRPVAAMAASIAVIASAALVSSRPEVAEASVPTFAEAILSTDMADWVESGEVPEIQTLLETFGGAER